MDKVKTLSNFISNGECLNWYENPKKVMKLEQLRQMYPITEEKKKFYEVSEMDQLKVLLRRGMIKTKRDQTLTHLRIAMNVLVALMLGWLYIGSGYDGARVIANYNLMFAILIHHVFSVMMLTILTCKQFYKLYFCEKNSTSTNIKKSLFSPYGKINSRKGEFQSMVLRQKLLPFNHPHRSSNIDNFMLAFLHNHLHYGWMAYGSRTIYSLFHREPSNCSYRANYRIAFRCLL